MPETFADLGIKTELITALTKQEISEPTPIQVAAIPLLLARKDAYLQSETGTGKTLAYLLPLYSNIDPKIQNAQLIVVAPTHELAIQIQRQCSDLSQLSGLAIRVILLIGGTSRDRQLEKLKKKPQVVIGSPGRIRELIQDGKLKAQQVRTVVIDEADRMLGSEGITDIRAIIAASAKERSLVFVSATQNFESVDLVDALAPNVIRVNASSAVLNAKIEHFYLRCDERDKPDLIRKLVHALNPERAIVFVHKNDIAEEVARRLAERKLKVADIHGVLTKENRKRAMDDIRSGKVQVLIASDVAARGLDIKGVTHIFNLDVPSESEAYLHRVGRTGRAGASGTALTLVSGTQTRLIERFQQQLGIHMTEVYVREGKVYVVE